VIYLASPYSHPNSAVRQWRFEAACRATALLLQAGVMVFSPIAHSHPLTRYGLPTDWAFWQRYDRAHLEGCSVLAVLALEGWGESAGVCGEIKIAKQLAMPLFLIDPAVLGITESPKDTPAEVTGVERGAG